MLLLPLEFEATPDSKWVKWLLHYCKIYKITLIRKILKKKKSLYRGYLTVILWPTTESGGDPRAVGHLGRVTWPTKPFVPFLK
jgi:hypothetical protein